VIEERHDFALTVAVDLLMASVTCALIVLIAACVVRVAAGVIVAWRGKEKPRPPARFGRGCHIGVMLSDQGPIAYGYPIMVIKW